MSVGRASTILTELRVCLRELFTEYETAKIVSFRTPAVAILHRFIQLFILVYIIGYLFVYEKGYQTFEVGESSVVAKVKGPQKTKDSGNNLGNGSWKGLTWDSADYVHPPIENDALFITTNVVLTAEQRPGICPQLFMNCTTDADCPEGESVHLGNGFLTGKCNMAVNACDVFAWCPMEVKPTDTEPILSGGENLTILVKNFISFPMHGIKRRNIFDTEGRNIDDDVISSQCRNTKHDPYCPIFFLGDIIERAGENFSEVAAKGAVFSFGIIWNCNFDFDEHLCKPTYYFRRLDDNRDNNIKGWNFRYSSYWNNGEGTQSRTLIKAFGIRIIFNVNAKAGSFNSNRFALNVGSCLGLIGIANFICDLLLFNCAKTDKMKYKEKSIRFRNLSQDYPSTSKQGLHAHSLISERLLFPDDIIHLQRPDNTSNQEPLTVAL